MKKLIPFISILIITVFSCKKEEAPPTVTGDKYFPKVRAIVQKNCTVSCHAPGLGFLQGLPVILETDSDIVNRANSIKAVVFGPFSITAQPMPPAGMLSDADKNIISEWLAKGATAAVCGLNH